jgi:hypothetical protein
VHLSPRGMVAFRQYRKVDEQYHAHQRVAQKGIPLGCLSPVMGNYHAGFLGGKGAVTPLTYPVHS